MPETKEAPPQNLYEGTLSQAVLVGTRTSCSMERSVLGESWDYEALFRRQPVSQERNGGERTVHG